MGQRLFYSVTLALLLMIVGGLARPAAARDLYPMNGAGSISSHNVTHTRGTRSNNHDATPLKLDDVIASKLAPGNALYVIPTLGIGTHSSAPAILFEGRF